MLDLYPVVRLKWEPGRDTIHTLFYGQVDANADGLEEFIDRHCLKFPARRIRRAERKILHANLVISRSPEFEPGDVEKTSTLDISEGGCFIYSVTEWECGQTIWLKCCDLTDETPVEATIAWAVPWGLPGKLPGIGVRFVKMTTTQRKELSSCLIMGFEPPDSTFPGDQINDSLQAS